MRIKLARTQLITGLVVGRWGIAVATLPRPYPWSFVLWRGRRQPIVYPPLPGVVVGGPVSYVR